MKQSGLITPQSYELLLNIFSAKPVSSNVPISYTKKDLVQSLGANATNFTKYYKCLTTHNIWKKIDGRYVIHPQLVFSGKTHWQDISFNHWDKGKLFTIDDKNRIIAANKHK
jgi:hypothetical protein